ncbi:MAG TPA: transglutaminase-like domain-containing protein [Pirellulaceae bacterium]|nr:transglutaminase-like domain-containing protein [Pirellulaceae bacterium]HMO91504.1 transglutaminase-like domain-containing protein [Pirellulaceae bacterium]HMP70977.1 transglutaminase-like domain-containing protein [Pirellulaceae bacterium]
MVHAQLGAGSASRDLSRLGEPVTQKWQVGVIISAGNQAAAGLKVMIPVPTDWPEQVVSLVEDDISDSVRNVGFLNLDGVKCMTANVPKINAHGAAKILQTYEVKIHPIALPANPESLLVPDKLDKDVKQYLNSSPMIDHRPGAIKKLVAELAGTQTSAWRQVESFYNWIIENVATTADEDCQGSSTTLRKKAGNDEDKINLFIAFCRAHKVPARIVWGEDTEYAEFFLVDENGSGSWFPCQPGINPEFGKLSEPSAVQQKGDNFKLPNGERRRFVPESVTGDKRSQPEIIFVRRRISN